MSSERSIPHLRDIFTLNSYPAPQHHQHQQQHQHHNYNHQNGSNMMPDIPMQQPQQQQPIDGYGIGGGGDLNKKQSRKKRDNCKTLTTGDVKTLERHLSMKKTIRKKIMRDLQQAFVDDPNEFKVDTANSEHLKAEINMEALRFGDNPNNKKSDNFLVMLRDDYQQQQQQQQHQQQLQQQQQYEYDAPKEEKQSFWKRFTMKNKTKR